MDKICNRCKAKKVENDFAIKSSSSEAKVRRDLICKACRAAAIKERRNSVRTHKIDPPAKVIIEPQNNSLNLTNRLIETQKLATTTNFECFNNSEHSAELQDKENSIQLLNEFVLILREEYAKLKNLKDIYVKE